MRPPLGTSARRFWQYVSVSVLERGASPVTGNDLSGAVGDMVPGAESDASEYANERVACDLRPAETGERPQSAQHITVEIRGHAFVQNLRRGHDGLGVDAFSQRLRLAAAFDELAQAIKTDGHDRHRARGPTRRRN